jgi:hypothetical protein
MEGIGGVLVVLKRVSFAQSYRAFRGGCHVWRTEIGERTLKSCEWELFRQGLWALWERIEDSFHDQDWYETGVAVFDRLPPASKLAMLSVVGSALHDENIRCPELNALTEGTFGAAYAVIREEIAIEIDLSREDPEFERAEWSMRVLVLEAFRESFPDSETPSAEPETEDQVAKVSELPAPDCGDTDEWDVLLDELMDRVLWGDRDYEDEDAFVDTDPLLSGHLKGQLGIDDEYFAAIAPEPTDQQLELIRKTLSRLCRGAENGAA